MTKFGVNEPGWNSKLGSVKLTGQNFVDLLDSKRDLKEYKGKDRRQNEDLQAF